MMPTNRSRTRATLRTTALALIGVLALTLVGCSSGGGSSNVARGVATPKRFVPSKTTTPGEAARRSEWRYQSKTRYHNVY